MADEKALRELAKAWGNEFEFYETPAPFTRYLFSTLRAYNRPIGGRVMEPCCGSGAIPGALAYDDDVRVTWTKNDLDPSWGTNTTFDAREPWPEEIGAFDWTVTNTPFSKAVEIADQALSRSAVGVALYLRLSFLEVTKTGPRLTWLREHRPTGLIFLPRFSHQRSRASGAWSSDSVACCWIVWLKEQESVDYSTGRLVKVPNQPFIECATRALVEETSRYEKEHRKRMDDFLEGARFGR